MDFNETCQFVSVQDSCFDEPTGWKYFQQFQIEEDEIEEAAAYNVTACCVEANLNSVCLPLCSYNANMNDIKRLAVCGTGKKNATKVDEDLRRFLYRIPYDSSLCRWRKESWKLLQQKRRPFNMFITLLGSAGGFFATHCA